MCGFTPRHNRSRRSGEGKSRPDTPPTQRGSRSKVICRGRPYWRKKVITASKAVCSWKSSRAWADRAIEVPASTKLQTRDHMLALALRTLFRRDRAHILLHPSGSLPTALGAHWSGVALGNVAPGNRWHAKSSRSFGWNGG